jgi:hypothetical protein
MQYEVPRCHWFQWCALPVSGCSCEPAVRLLMTTPMGATQEHVFTSPHDLASTLLEGMEAAPHTQQALFRDIRVSTQAELLFLSCHRWDTRIQAGARGWSHVDECLKQGMHVLLLRCHMCIARARAFVYSVQASRRLSVLQVVRCLLWRRARAQDAPTDLPQAHLRGGQSSHNVC